jgi:hypothetical protein
VTTKQDKKTKHHINACAHLTRLKKAIVIVLAVCVLMASAVFLGGYQSKAIASGNSSYVTNVWGSVQGGDSLDEAMLAEGFMCEGSDGFPPWVRELAGEDAFNLFATEDCSVAMFCIDGEADQIVRKIEERANNCGWTYIADEESCAFVLSGNDSTWVNVSYQSVGNGVSFVCNVS